MPKEENHDEKPSWSLTTQGSEGESLSDNPARPWPEVTEYDDSSEHHHDDDV